jgi:predicted transcriptional regulator of viral defense system
MTKTDEALDAAREQGLIRPRDLRRRGLPPRLLRRLAERGAVERVGRGLYRHPEAPLTEHHSLALVSKRYPEARGCLLSALQFHEMTTQWPRVVWVALAAGARKPEASPTKLQVARMSGPALTEGTEEHILEGVPAKMYGPAKTVADCFKFRSRVGLGVALEALRSYLRERDGPVDNLFRHADICRVQDVMHPYVEAMGQQEKQRHNY